MTGTADLGAPIEDIGTEEAAIVENGELNTSPEVASKICPLDWRTIRDAKENCSNLHGKKGDKNWDSTDYDACVARENGRKSKENFCKRAELEAQKGEGSGPTDYWHKVIHNIGVDSDADYTHEEAHLLFDQDHVHEDMNLEEAAVTVEVVSVVEVTVEVT